MTEPQRRALTSLTSRLDYVDAPSIEVHTFSPRSRLYVVVWGEHWSGGVREIAIEYRIGLRGAVQYMARGDRVWKRWGKF